MVERIMNVISDVKSFVEKDLDYIQEGYFVNLWIDKLKDKVGDFLKDQAAKLVSRKTPKDVVQERIDKLYQLFETSELPE